MIKIANAPCSWGVLEFELTSKAAGYELVLDEIRDTGYEGSELGDWGFMPTDPAGLRQALDKRNLSMVGAFVPVFLKERTKHLPGAAMAVKTAKLMADAGYPEAFIVLSDDNCNVPERTLHAGRVTSQMGLTDAEWQIFAEGANFIAAEVNAKAGLRTVFHHHCAGYVETPYETDHLMALTDPTLVGLVLDMGHYQFGGGDPLTALIKYRQRIRHIHFKDCDPVIAEKSVAEGWDYFESVRNGVFCELGKGAVDFAAITAELKRQHYDGWIVVEQDVLPGMGNPKICAQRNREFIRSLGL